MLIYKYGATSCYWRNFFDSVAFGNQKLLFTAWRNLGPLPSTQTNLETRKHLKTLAIPMHRLIFSFILNCMFPKPFFAVILVQLGLALAQLIAAGAPDLLKTNKKTGCWKHARENDYEKSGFCIRKSPEARFFFVFSPLRWVPSSLPTMVCLPQWASPQLGQKVSVANKIL